MPFGVKDTGAAPPDPTRVDFDALWKLAIAPALDRLGYKAVRADQDIGPLIIKEMLERLYYSDLIVADVSIANANAYYEVGIRHAAREDGCVLIAADWSRPVFDLAQIRHVPYPNSVAKLDDTTAVPICEALENAIPTWSRSKTPMVETIAGYPNAVHDGNRSRELAGELEAFEMLRAELSGITLVPKEARATRVAEIVAKHPAAGTMRAPIAIEMVKFLRDKVGDWKAALEYIEALPESIRRLPFMLEQRALAQSKQGNHAAAIDALNALIALSGDTSERQGLLGGRYKKLYGESVKRGKPDRQLLEAAIKHYDQGMRFDLNDYYSACNLPALYRERAKPGDEGRARAAAAVARIACERSLKRNFDDEWGKPTLLGLAFAERSVSAAQEIAELVEAELGAGWKLESTLDDLVRHVGQTTEPSVQAELRAIVDRLSKIL